VFPHNYYITKSRKNLAGCGQILRQKNPANIGIFLYELYKLYKLS